MDALPDQACAPARMADPSPRRGERTGGGDVLISAQYDRIVDCHRLNGARAYNFHFAPLPRYRGSLTSALSLRHDEVEPGVTLHDLVQEVDAGGIIAARSFEVPSFYSSYDLYIAYHRNGFELIRENACALLSGTATSSPQGDSLATAFNRSAIDFTDMNLERFDRPADEIRDWCRSSIFPPSQYPQWRGRPIGSCDTVVLSDSVPLPGTVVHDSQGLVLVACLDALLALEMVSDS
jgi:methionyl-tRNA formyltransferase